MYHSDFVHLHLHSEYSLLDGACHLDKVIEKAVEYRMPAMALTDHGNMFAAIDFYQKAMKAGVKPIIGAEMYIAPFSRFDKKKENGIPPAFHLVLLCRNEQGYKNLLKLTTAGFFDGFYYYPRIDKEILSKHSDGLIALSACLKGEVAYYLIRDKDALAERALERYLDIFGKENFYLEVQENGIAEQAYANKKLVSLSKKYNVGLVATNDVHYIEQKHAKAHEVLLCIQTQTTINDENRMRLSTDMFYFASPDEMKRRFKDLPEAIENTLKIAERCNVEIEFGKNHLPVFTPPGGIDSKAYLMGLCEDALPKKYSEGMLQKARERLSYEVGVIEKMGYINYFLIVWDFIRYARENNIPSGPGRGSAAGSIVSYLLGITSIDPLRYNLLFERFLNPDRVSMPDIDIDFCYENRQKVIDYVVEKYGRDNVAQIITFGTMKARAVVRDVARALGLPYALADKIAKKVPFGASLKEAINIDAELKGLYENDAQVKDLLDISLVLEGLTRHASTHAAGVVISDRPLIEYTPLFKSDNQVSTAYPMKPIEKIGLLKMDFLGLKTLTVVNKAVKFIEQTIGKKIDMNAVALDDPATYELLGEAKTKGVFQLESSGMRELLVRIKPDKFEDIIALLALYRPGPIGSGMLDDFVERRKGKEIEYMHPVLEPILKETYGVILYQEQVMQIASSMAGFSLAQADLLRRAMGKKIPEEMEKQRSAFIEGCLKNRIDRKIAQKMFELIEYFSGYGFNKSHSAAYAVISYWTAYLKANYPKEFIAALLTSEHSNTEKLVDYIKDAEAMGIKVLPPDINKSFYEFTVEGDAIRFGLCAVKNVGEGPVEAIVQERLSSGPYKDMLDFCIRLSGQKVNKKVLEFLIKSSAFDCFSDNRRAMFESIDKYIQIGARRRQEIDSGQMSLFGSSAQIKDSALIAGDSPRWDEHMLLSYEKEALGMYLSGHPLSRYAELILHINAMPIDKSHGSISDNNVLLAGVVNRISTKVVKKTQEKMAFFVLEDLSGEIECLVFPSVYKDVGRLIEENKVVLVKARIDKGENGGKAIVSKIWDIERVEDLVEEVKIDITSLDKPALGLLREKLNLHRGDVPVLFYVKGSYEYVSFYPERDLFVSPGLRFLEDVEDVLGGKNIILKLGGAQ